MLNDFNCSCPVYIACGYTDLRRGIDGLANLVKSQFQMDPFQRALFLFCGRRRDRPEHGRGAGPDTSTVPLADGGAEDRAAEGKQGSVRPERNLMPESAESIGFLACFVVSFTHGT